MNWTATPPKEPGFYWHRDQTRPSGQVTIVKGPDAHGEWQAMGWDCEISTAELLECGGEWGDRLDVPAEDDSPAFGRWISVLDRRPEENHGVLAWITGGSLHLGEDYLDVAIYLNGIWRANCGLDDEPVQVSHWMPKPKAPIVPPTMQ